MVDTSYFAQATRPQWGGTDADLDIHREAYEGDIESSFKVESMFRSGGLTNFKSVADQSNSWRGDRMGGVQVKGRKAGQQVDNQRIVNEKYIITVDTLSYVRTPVDYMDEWTAPSYRAEISAEHSSAHAKSFDRAHIIQLIKAGQWKAPEDLKNSGAFYDGLFNTMTGYTAETDLSAKADIIVQYHKAQLAEFVKRDLGGSLQEFKSLIEPDVFSVLLEHNKLMNVEFASVATGQNDYAMRRVAIMNGIQVIETPRIPTVAETNHHLGAGFNITAAEAKSRIITFHPKKTLVTVEAKPMFARIWDDQKELTNVIDSMTMYTVGIRRGDATGVLLID